jgi:flagellar basal body-associated protein FliL
MAVNMPKKKRIFVLLAIPVAAILWCIGWSLYWIGEKKEKSKPAPVNKTRNLTPAIL